MKPAIRHVAGASALGALAVLLWPAAAAADRSSAKQECADAYVSAQEARQTSELLRSRVSLRVCAQKACMKAIQRDCIKWLGEVEASMPSITIQAVDPDGNDTLSVKVILDGDLLANELSGKSLEVDPGSHQLRLELAGSKPVERTIVLPEGKKNRLIEVQFEREGSEVEEKPLTSKVGEKPGGGIGEPPLLTYILGGAAAASLVASTALWIKAGKDRKSLLDCRPACRQSDVDSVETKRLVGDIFLGVGVVSLGAAAYFWFAPSAPGKPTKDSAQVRVDLQASPRGGFAGVTGSF